MNGIDARLEKARVLLNEGDYTCVLKSDDEVYTSKERGVKPLLDFLNSEKDFKGFFAADKTVGAGAAHLYVLLGVRAIWSRVVSESAKQILAENGIDVFYEICAPHIINRRGDGICPIESAVASAKSSEDALNLIKQTLKRLSAGTNG